MKIINQLISMHALSNISTFRDLAGMEGRKYLFSSDVEKFPIIFILIFLLPDIFWISPINIKKMRPKLRVL